MPAAEVSATTGLYATGAGVLVLMLFACGCFACGGGKKGVPCIEGQGTPTRPRKGQKKSDHIV